MYQLEQSVVVEIYEKMITLGELERLWRGAVVAYFRAPSRHPTVGLRKTTKYLSVGSRELRACSLVDDRNGTHC